MEELVRFGFGIVPPRRKKRDYGEGKRKITKIYMATIAMFLLICAIAWLVV